MLFTLSATGNTTHTGLSLSAVAAVASHTYSTTTIVNREVHGTSAVYCSDCVCDTQSNDLAVIYPSIPSTLQKPQKPKTQNILDTKWSVLSWTRCFDVNNLSGGGCVCVCVSSPVKTVKCKCDQESSSFDGILSQYLLLGNICLHLFAVDFSVGYLIQRGQRCKKKTQRIWNLQTHECMIWNNNALWGTWTCSSEFWARLNCPLL